jgi:hypothetical protein
LNAHDIAKALLDLNFIDQEASDYIEPEITAALDALNKLRHANNRLRYRFKREAEEAKATV